MQRILIGAGGTGGHIYPALSVAEEIMRQHPDVTIEFVGSLHGLENKLIPEHGYPLHRLVIGRLNSNVSLVERIRTLVFLPFTLLQVVFILIRSRPILVLGFGGHASGPLLLMSSTLGFPSAIWEPNALPGLANRILSRFVADCWLVFENAKSHIHSKRIHSAGMPVRSSIENVSEPGRRTSGNFHVLVFGGSQGARGINEAVSKMLIEFSNEFANVQVVHQTGPTDFEKIKLRYQSELSSEAQSRVEVLPFLNDMDVRYQWADLVVCRAGTGTLSEIAACKKASILIPLPTAADDHQRKNAESLVEAGAAKMILQPGLTPLSLKSEILRLMNSSAEREQMGQRVHKFHRPNAARALVQDLWKTLLER